jgi:hypothetical protein
MNRNAARLLSAAALTTLAVGAVAVGPAALEQQPAEAKRKLKLGSSGSSGSGGSGGSGADATDTAAGTRSVAVSLTNSTGCTLTYSTAKLTDGVWVDDAHPNRDKNDTSDGATTIADGKEWSFASQARFPLVGTEGEVEWRTTACRDANLDGKTVKFHWNNRPVIPNAYDFDGTDAALEGSKDGGFGNGWGRDAQVSITVKGR